MNLTEHKTDNITPPLSLMVKSIRIYSNLARIRGDVWENKGWKAKLDTEKKTWQMHNKKSFKRKEKLFHHNFSCSSSFSPNILVNI